MTTFAFQINVKTADGTLVNVQADDFEELTERVADLTGFADKVTELATALGAVATLNAFANAVQAPAAGPAAIAPAPFIPTQGGAPAAPVAAPPAGTMQDRYGNTWEYGNPGAPTTPNGPAVKGTKMSKAGKPYVMWYDPAAGPQWTGPKIPKEQQWEAQFAR